MATHVDDREQLEPGAGLLSAPPPTEGGLLNPDPYAGFEDYFGFDETETWYFPDGKQWIQFRKMNEGVRSRFMRATRPDVTINQKSGDAKVPFDQSKERHELIMMSCINWLIVRRNEKDGRFEPVPFSTGSDRSALGVWLTTANPALVADLEKAIRKANPWMLTEMTVEQIDKEIADLQELRKAAAEREEREAAFHSAG